MTNRELVLEWVNGIRAKHDLEPLTALIPGVPYDAFRCVIANSVGQGLPGDMYASACRTKVTVGQFPVGAVDGMNYETPIVVHRFIADFDRGRRYSDLVEAGT